MKRGKPWSWDECYLAVWLYDLLDYSPCPGTKTSYYNKISNIIGRTAKSVEYKIQNVAAIDPRAANQKPICSLDHVQRQLIDVFNWYWQDRESARKFYNEVVSRITTQQNSQDCPPSKSQAKAAEVQTRTPSQADTPKQ